MDEVTVFGDDRMKQAKMRLTKMLAERYGKMNVGMTGDGQIHPESMLNMLAGMQSMMIGLKQEQILLGAVLKVMSLGLADDQVEAVIENSVMIIDKTIEQIDEATKPKSTIIQPGPGAIPPDLNNRMGG